MIVFLLGCATSASSSSEGLDRSTTTGARTGPVDKALGGSPNAEAFSFDSELSHDSIKKLIRGAELVWAEFDGDPRSLYWSYSQPRPERLEELRTLALSTGDASLATPSPGLALHGSTSLPDQATLKLGLQPASHSSMLYVTYKFLTVESAESAGAGFNDGFELWITDNSGQRLLTRSDASSGSLTPVSAMDADGLGFERYFTGSLKQSATRSGDRARALTSGWRTAAFSIDRGNEILFELTVQDRGDGIMDSTVLIGQIVIANTLVPELFNVRGADCISADDFCDTLLPPYPVPSPASEYPPPVCDAFGLVERKLTKNLREPRNFGGVLQPGGAADGATRFPVAVGRNLTEGPFDQAEISLVSGQAPLDGGLGVFGSLDRLQSIVVPAVELQPDFWAAGAQFYVPENYWHAGLPGDQHGQSRTVEIQFCFQNTVTNAELCVSNEALPAFIYRPAAILMHGLWSKPDTWSARSGFSSVPAGSNSPLLSLQDVPIVLGNYSANDDNARSFSHNQFVPDQALRQACQALRSFSSYGVRHDYLGHSMGGNIARVYSQVSGVRKLNRLVTLNTPHLGSPLANRLVSLRDNAHPVVSLLLTWAMRERGQPIDLGAIDDLAVGSDAILLIVETPVEAHAIVGVGGTLWADDGLQNAPETDGDIYRLVRFLSDPAEIFGEEQHDPIVSRPSQAGGIPSEAQTILEGLLSLHTFASVNPEAAYRVYCDANTNQPPYCLGGLGEGLFNRPASSNEFAPFPSPSSVSITLAPTLRARPEVPDGEITLIEGKLQLTTPSIGAIFSPGDIVNVEIVGVDGFQPERVLLLTPVEVIEDTNAPFEFSLQLPDNFAGDLRLAAIGVDANQQYSRLDNARVSVVPTSALNGVSIGNETLLGSSLIRVGSSHFCTAAGYRSKPPKWK